MPDSCSGPCGEDQPWLTDDEQSLWRSYLAVTKRLWEQLDKDLEDSMGISLNDYDVLVCISEAEGGSIRMSALADRTFQSKSSLSHSARRLEERGVISRRTTVSDKRGRLCELTDAGRELLESAAPHHVASVRERLLSPLSPVDRQHLGTILTRICQSNPSCQSTNPESC